MWVSRVLAFRNRMEEKKNTNISENVSTCRENIAKRVIEIQKI